MTIKVTKTRSPNQIHKSQFLQRFTLQEQVAYLGQLNAARQAVNPDLAQLTLMAAAMNFDSVNYLDKTSAATGQFLDVLVAAGIITEARKAEVLA